jgi:hypothetical protein
MVKTIFNSYEEKIGQTIISEPCFVYVYRKNNIFSYFQAKLEDHTNGKDAPVHVKDLWKVFNQVWDKRRRQTSIKKLLMGHSTRIDVDLMHYNGQSIEDLKQIYDKVIDGLVISGVI